MKTFKLFTIERGERVYLPSFGEYACPATFDVDLREWTWKWTVIHGYGIFEGRQLLLEDTFQETYTVHHGDKIIVRLPSEDKIPCLDLYINQIERMLAKK